MKVGVAPLVCALYCFISVASKKTCWRSKIFKLRRDYKNGVEAGVAYKDAVLDMASHFDKTLDNMIIPAYTNNDADYPLIHKTITKFTIMAEESQVFHFNVVMHFYDINEIERKIIRSQVQFEDEIAYIHIDKTYRISDEFADDCVEEEYLNSMLFTEKV
uniref:Cystatin domain-containing protein n=1 Tax=Angiostrongylus cantonensis TaxID=6313 RepID=A0A0K0DMN5_ANGCA